jgi:AcrR family transcriptional regulator
MSFDMLAAHQEPRLTERKQEILQQAIGIIATKGYRALTMRALARAVGMKLGALQYHFRTRQDMLRALASYIWDAYRRSFEVLDSNVGEPSLKDLVRVAVADPEEIRNVGDALFTQLWAMARIEPVIDEKLHEFYAEYVERIAERLTDLGSRTPVVDALVIASLVEGSILFTGSGRPWANEENAVLDAIMEFIEARYGSQE